jgi:hypothetical protein
VHEHEGAWNDNPYNTASSYWGGMQFDLSTWVANGGARFNASRPDLVSPHDQLVVAYETWRWRGWQPWPTTAATCGLL